MAVDEVVHGAVLAEEALRILGRQSPQIALEALELREEAEVMAECGFTGTTRHLRSQERIESLRHTARSILSGGQNVEWRSENALVSVVGDVRRIYGQFERYDEEQDALNAIRKLENSLYRRSRNVLVGLVPYCVRRYMNLLFDSGIAGITLAVLCWVAAFGLLYSLLLPLFLGGEPGSARSTYHPAIWLSLVYRSAAKRVSERC